MTEPNSRNCAAVLRDNLCRLIGAEDVRLTQALRDAGVGEEVLGRVLAEDARQLRLNDLSQLATALGVEPHDLLRAV